MWKPQCFQSQYFLVCTCTRSLKTMNTIFWMCSGGLSGMCIIEKVQLQTLTCFVQWSWYNSSSNVVYSVLTDSCSWDTPLHALPPLSSDSQDQGWDPHLNLFTWINQHDGLIWQSNLNSIYDGLIWQSNLNQTVSMTVWYDSPIEQYLWRSDMTVQSNSIYETE